MSFWGDLARIGTTALGTVVAPGLGTAIGSALGNAIGNSIDGGRPNKNTTQGGNANVLGQLTGNALGTIGNALFPGIGGSVGGALGNALGSSIFGQEQQSQYPSAAYGQQSPPTQDYSKENKLRASPGFTFGGKRDNPWLDSLFTMTTPGIIR